MGLKLSTAISDGQDYSFIGDASRIKQVMYLLLDNAIRYTPIGEIWISLEKRDRSMLFSVKDTGVGIDLSEVPNLFTKFGRGKEAQKVNPASNGLGLFLAKEFVTAHKGHIWVSAGKKRGANSFVEFPTEIIHL